MGESGLTIQLNATFKEASMTDYEKHQNVHGELVPKRTDRTRFMLVSEDGITWKLLPAGSKLAVAKRRVQLGHDLSMYRSAFVIRVDQSGAWHSIKNRYEGNAEPGMVKAITDIRDGKLPEQNEYERMLEWLSA
jgi:hypothetical protein